MVVFWVLLCSAGAQSIPAHLLGKWVVTRVLPAGGVSCWSGKEAKRLVGTEIEYTGSTVRWGNQEETYQLAGVSELTDDKFHQEFSGSGGQVSLAQVGIRADRVTLVSFTHPEMWPIHGAYEIVGEDVLLKDQNSIIVVACGVFFEAHRR